MGIRLECRVEVPTELFVDGTDLCIILGNLLDNALEAVENLPLSQRLVKLVVRLEKGALYIMVENPYAGEIVEMGDLEHIFERIEHPYTRGLFDSLPNAVGEGNRLKPIEGLMPDPSNLPQGCKFSPRCPYATKECLEKPAVLTEVEPGHFVQCYHHGCMKKEKSRIEEGGDGNGRNQRK